LESVVGLSAWIYGICARHEARRLVRDHGRGEAAEIVRRYKALRSVGRGERRFLTAVLEELGRAPAAE
jgi:hypothetical protein